MQDTTEPPDGRLEAFARHHGLDSAALLAQDPFPAYEIVGDPDATPGALPSALHLIGLGRYGNRLYQLLNVSMVARKLALKTVYVDDPQKVLGLPIGAGGLDFMSADENPDDALRLRGVFLHYKGFEPVVEPLDAGFIETILRDTVAPLFPSVRIPPMGAHVLVLHFRGGDVFAGAAAGSWVPSHYVMPPAAFYIRSIDHAIQQRGVTEIRLVYEDRQNPAIRCVEEHCTQRRIPFLSQSGTLLSDAATLREAAHLCLPYGSFGEAGALLSERIRTLYSFRAPESHDWFYARPKSLVETVLHARGARVFVLNDEAESYIPAWGWNASAEQLALLEGFPAERLTLEERLPT